MSKKTDSADSEQSFVDFLSKAAQLANQDNDLQFLKSRQRIGKFKILRLLGVGGQASCFLALDEDLDRKVVLKLYKQSLSKARREQIFQEGRALAKVRSQNVAQCFGVEQFEGRPYLVLEYIEGVTLEEWAGTRSVDPYCTFDIVFQITSALEAIHEAGLLHLDIKPGNIIIAPSNHVSLIDFGISQATDADCANIVAGSPSFLAPECLTDAGADQRTDIYGVGAIMLFLLTGRAPIEAESKSLVIQKLRMSEIDLHLLESSTAPKRLIEVCTKCLAVNPENRFSSARELKEELGDKKTKSNALYFRTTALLSLAALTIVMLFFSMDWGQKKPSTNPTIRHQAAEIVNFVKAKAKSVPIQNHFAVQISIERLKDGKDSRPFSTFAANSTKPFEGTGTLELDLTDSYLVSVESERDCFVSLFSIESVSPGTSQLGAVLMGDGNTAISSNEPLEFLTLDELTASKQTEYLWLIATEKPLEDPTDLARFISDRLEMSNKPQLNPGSGVHRGIGKTTIPNLSSEVFFPYFVQNSSSSTNHTAGKKHPSGGPLISVGKTLDVLHIAPVPDIANLSQSNSIRHLLANSQFEEARQLLDSKLNQLKGSHNAVPLLKQYLLETLARFSEAEGNFELADQYWQEAAEHHEPNPTGINSAKVFSTLCREQMCRSLAEKSVLSTAHKQLLIGEFTNDLTMIEQAFNGYQTVFGSESLLCKIAYLTYHQKTGRIRPTIGRNNTQYNRKELFNYFNSLLGSANLYTLDAKLMVSLEEYSELGPKHVVSKLHGNQIPFETFAQIDPDRLIRLQTLLLFYYSDLEFLDEGKHSIALIHEWLSDLHPACPAYEFIFKIRQARFLNFVVGDQNNAMNKLYEAYISYQDNKAFLESTNATDVLEFLHGLTGIFSKLFTPAAMGYSNEALRVCQLIPEGQRAEYEATTKAMRVDLLLRMGRPGVAREFVNDAIRLVKPHELELMIPYTIQLAKICFHEGKFDDALQQIDSLGFIDNPALLAFRAFANFKSGNRADAMSDIVTAHRSAWKNSIKHMSSADVFEAVKRLNGLERFRNQANAFALASKKDDDLRTALEMTLATKGLSYSFLSKCSATRNMVSGNTKLELIANRLPKDTCILEFIKHSPLPSSKETRQRYGVFIIRRAEELEYELIDLGDVSSVDALVAARWATIVRNDQKRANQSWEADPNRGNGVGDSNQETVLDQFDELVWTKIHEHVTGARKLLICPTGKLTEFPWSSIQVPTSGSEGKQSSFLMQGENGFELVVQQSAGEIAKRLVTNRSRNPDCLIVGGLDFGDGKKFPPLPNSLHEAKATNDRYTEAGKTCHLLTGSDVSKAAILDRIAICGIIQIATHGVIMSELEGGKSDLYFVQNMLSERGIALSMANEFISKGDLCNRVLTAAEILEVDMSQVDLVVLSSCYSAVGRLLSNELFGFEKGCRLAGAHSTLTCLSTLDDKYAQLFVDAFHKHRIKGLAKGAAFRMAQLEMIEQNVPYENWCCWILSGDWD